MTTINTEYYINLITSEHANKPKYVAWMKVLLTPFIDAINLNKSIKSAFYINNAVGVQLDIIGKWLGLSRQVDFQPTNGSSSILNDKYYRIALKAKIVKNLWKGTIEDFYNMWQILFNGEDLQVYLADNQNMDYVIVTWDSTTQDPMISDLLRNGYIIPRPAGLGTLYVDVDSDEVFGFDGSDFQPFNQGVFWPNN